MRQYALRRVFWMLPTLLVVSALTFFGLNALPGDIAVLYLGDNATPAELAAFREANGLDEPVVVRYVR